MTTTILANAPEFARDALATTNPWEVLPTLLDHQDAVCLDQALVILLEDARRQAQELSQVQDEYNDMVAHICDATEADLAHTLSLETPLRGQRPADVYRRWAKPLRWIVQHELPAGTTLIALDQCLHLAVAHGVFPHLLRTALLLRDLTEMQTLPLSELDNPDWVDPYLGTVDDSWEEPVPLELRAELPLPEYLQGIAQDLHWSEDTARAYLAAQEGFNSEDGLDLQWDDERSDARDPHWMEIQNDLKPTDELPDLKVEAQPLLDALTDFADKVDAFLERTTPAGRWHNAQVAKQRRQTIRASRERREFLDWLQDQARAGKAIQDLGYIFLGAQTGFTLDYQDAEEIQLDNYHVIRTARSGLDEENQHGTLLEWLDDNGDELLESLNDRSPNWAETDLRELDKFDTQTRQFLIGSELTARDITRHPAWLRGFYTAMIDGHDLTEGAAVQAAWESYRQEVSPTGNQAFHAALQAGRELKAAMSEFWRIKNAEERLQKEASVVGILPNNQGLRLSSGRQIPWPIAVKKLQNQELYLPAERRTALKAKLTELKFGPAFAELL